MGGRYWSAVRLRHGRTVKTCWTAHAKELNGISPRKAANRISGRGHALPCRAIIRPIIEQSESADDQPDDQVRHLVGQDRIQPDARA